MGALAQSPANAGFVVEQQMTVTPRSPTRGYLIACGNCLPVLHGILISHLSRTYQLPSLVLAFWRDSVVCLAWRWRLSCSAPAGSACSRVEGVLPSCTD